MHWKPKLFPVNLDASRFPSDFLSGSKSQKLVSLTTQVQNVTKDITIPISSQSGYMFIQSDKPIYTPKERVFFRIIPLTENGLPSTERFQFQIRNPQGIIVDEKIYNERRKYLPSYFADPTYSFPKHPSLGEWKAIVNYGNNLELNTSITFELKEYVLPTFTVKIQTPDVILPSADSITVTVTAEYVYGKKVNGVVTLRVGVRKDKSLNVIYFGRINPKKLTDGSLQNRIFTENVKAHEKIGWFPGIEGSSFVVEATVIDDATGNKMFEVDSSTKFSKSPFMISFKRCLPDFKPGLPSVFEAAITYVNGKPAEGISTKITAAADNNRRLNIVLSSAKSNENGIVSFEYHPEIHHRTITLTLETDDSRYAGNQAKGTFVQKAYLSTNNAFIAISRMSPLRLRPGDSFSRDVHFEPKGINNIYVLVVAKGKILLVDKLREGSYKVHRMDFTITHDMVPNFRAVVFAHVGNDLIADSLKIDVEKICSPNAEVFLSYEFNDKVPGSTGKIILRGVKGTSVGLLGVDEAVYALSRKDLLSKDKMFEKLASHDLGCGPGGGENIYSVLGNAGITVGTNKFTPSVHHSCVEIKRKKRSLVQDLVYQYKGEDRVCCTLGLRPDKHKRECMKRYEAFKTSLENIKPNCSAVFLECCMHGDRKDINGWVSLGRVSGADHDELDFFSPEEEDDFERLTTVRKDFRQTWIYTNHTIGSNNKTEVQVSLPHSITTWVIQAVSVNPTHGICVAEEKKLVSMKKIFLHVNIPYSIKLYEQMEVEVTVFNYGDRNMSAYVYMHGVDGICSGTEPGMKSERKKVYVGRQSAETVTFSIIPLRVEEFKIKFVALSIEGSDVIEKTLNVVPQGVREDRSISIKLDPTNKQKRVKRHVEEELFSDFIDADMNLQVIALKIQLPNGTVPGTAVCSITASGDLLGPAVETCLYKPDDLIKKPSGCGEQTLKNLGPTVYTMRYLKAIDKLTPDRKKRGEEFIRAGYDNELRFKKIDGSYSIWEHTPSSTWLTAFVLKVFCQATEFIPIDSQVLKSGLEWLVRNQERDGSFIEKHPVVARDMMGGVNGTVSMTAFALITLQECKHDSISLSQAKQRAVAYLEGRITNTRMKLPAAIIAYALALSNSNLKHVANDRLLSMSKRDADRNFLYWTTKNSAQDIETAGYALLTQLLFNDINNSSSIVNWLNTKQLQSGSYKSTQDTVIAIQALSQFAIMTTHPEYSTTFKQSSFNMISNITISNDANYYEMLKFNGNNALEVQEVKIEDPDGLIFINTAGYGMATLSMNLSYNVMKPEAEICKFDISVTLEEVILLKDKVKGVEMELDKVPLQRRRRDENSNYFENSQEKEIKRRSKRENKDRKSDYALKVDICVKYLASKDAEMSIVDVGIFSGFEPVVEDLEQLENDEKHLIQRYEKSNRGVVFYLDKVPVDKPYCFSFEIQRKYLVGNTQSSTIKVYDYYNPDATCTKFYTPEKKSAIIKTICDDGVCICAEGGCTPQDPFSKFSEMDDADRRDEMKLMFCDQYDYVWKGKLAGRMRKVGGLLNITFRIEEVIKAGSEAKKDLENKTRILRAQDHCETSYLFAGSTYLILGKDPPMLKVDKVTQYKYYLDKRSIIYRWTSAPEPEDEDLQRDLDQVTYELKTDGCDD